MKNNLSLQNNIKMYGNKNDGRTRWKKMDFYYNFELKKIQKINNFI